MKNPFSKKKSLVQEFMDRTVEGTHAFRAAATKRHPGRIGYLAAGALSVVAAATRADGLTRAVKPALMPLLATSVLIPDATPSDRSTWTEVVTPNADQAVLLAGLAGGWLGDLTLMNKQSRSEEPAERAKNLNKGAMYFSLNQLAYIWLMLRNGAQFEEKAGKLRAGAVLAGTGLSAIRSPRTIPAATIYGSLLGATSTLGEDRALIRGSVKKTPQDYGISHGANLFVVSDALLLARQTIFKNAQKKGAAALAKAADMVTDGAVMATYTIAQLLLVDGLNRK